MALEEYKKVVNITDRDSITGELTYRLLYINTDSSYDYQTHKDIYQSIPKVVRIPTANDKMYFLSDVTIPRFKIKNFCEKTGARVVKYLESGNYVIIGKKTIEKFFTHEYYVEYDKDQFIYYIDLLMSTMRFPPLWITNLKQLILDSNENVFVNQKYSLTNYFDKDTALCRIDSATHSQISYEKYDRLINIMNLTCDIVEEDVILRELNKDTVMDKEIFESIQKLFESVDMENTKLAMELMSNCDFGKSAPYLLLLLKEHGNKIYSSTTKHHVNFKGMLNYFDLTANSIVRMNFNEILRVITSKKLLYKSSIQVLKDVILEDMATSTYYKTTDIIFIDENEEEVPIIDDTIIPELSKVEEIMQVDDIIWDELTEVIDYFKEESLSKYRDKLLEIRHLVTPSEELLPIIKYLDENYQYELGTLLTQSYLSLP